jgi:uncharacterized membrane protein YdjX (TVP38/TMEM64 family)
VKVILVLAGFGVLGTAFLASLADAADWAAAVLDVLDSLRELGPLGWFALVGLQTLVALIGFLPASLLGLAAGAVYGVGLGFGLAASGVLIGAGVAFVLARSTLRPTIVCLLDGRAALGRFDAALTKDGWRLVLLLRVSPVMPFSLTSFALGLSGIGFRSYALGTLASLPALLLYVCIGTLGANSIATAHSGSNPLHLALLGVGIAATLLLTVRIGWMLTRAVRTDNRSF